MYCLFMCMLYVYDVYIIIHSICCCVVIQYVSILRAYNAILVVYVLQIHWYAYNINYPESKA